MANEQEHVNDFQARTKELGGSCSWLGIFLQMAGRLLGSITTLPGRVFLLKTDIGIEKRAVKEYGDFLQRVGFDERFGSLIEKNIQD